MQKAKNKKLLAGGILACVCALSLFLGALLFSTDAYADAPEYKMEYPQVSQLTLPSILSDGMVMQQGEQVHIWGLTVAGRTVTASLYDGTGTSLIRSASDEADTDGRFDIYFDGEAASFDAYRIKVGDGETETEIEDVLFGEVWLTGGQSNMELQLQYIIDGTELIRTATRGSDGYDYDKLRIFLEPTMPEGTSINSDFHYLPQFDIAGARWGKANVKDDVKVVSGVSYACAQQMFKELNADGAEVPVALINTAVGATSIETWMSRGSIDDTPEVLNWIQNIKKNYVSYENWNTASAEKFNQMTAMFNEKIAPIAGYPVKGLLWYQGENNMGDQESADFYSKALPAMVEDWSRNWWGYDEPFYCAFFHINQKEDNYTPESIPLFLEGLSTAWSENRDFMMQVPIYDIPLTWNWGPFQYKATAHPLVKVPVGERAARIVLGNVYKKYEYSLPATYTGMRVEGNSVYLTFENTAGGLVAKDGQTLRGFTVCGSDRNFVAAEAEIVDANTVRVWSDDLETPVAATYAFTCFNYSSNLYNGIGLPVVPFRTDRVASSYYHAKDWMFADSVQLWIDNGLAPTDEGAASLRDVWQTNPITMQIGSSLAADENGVAGAAIRMNYSSAGTYGFGVCGPEGRTGALNNMIFGQFGRFAALSFSVRNGDAREKTLTVAVKTFGGEEYILPFAGETIEPSYTLSAGAAFTEVRVLLNCMIDESGNYRFDTEDILNDLAALEIRVSDSAAGSVAVDEFVLHAGDSPAQEARSVSGVFEDGVYFGSGGNAVSADGRAVLLLGASGAAYAEYDAGGALRAEIEILARGGSAAYRGEGAPAVWSESADVSQLLPAYIGSDGFRYTVMDGVWYRYIAGENAWRPLTGEGALFPKVTLPETLTPAVRLQALIGGEWTEIDGSPVRVSSAGGGCVSETYSFSLPAGTEKIRAWFAAEERAQEANGNIGMAEDRGELVMLANVSLTAFGETEDTSDPQILLRADRAAYAAGDTVTLSVAAADDRAGALTVQVKKTENGQEQTLEGNTFTFTSACTIEVTATDAAGHSATASLTLSEAQAQEPAGGGSAGQDAGGNDGAAIAAGVLAGVAVLTAAAALVMVFKKGGKRQ